MRQRFGRMQENFKMYELSTAELGTTETKEHWLKNSRIAIALAAEVVHQVQLLSGLSVKPLRGMLRGTVIADLQPMLRNRLRNTVLRL